jgi:hypothetical protein
MKNSQSILIAGEPQAELILSDRDRHTLNGALSKLNKRIHKPDRTMNDELIGKRLREELEKRTK